MTVRKVGVRGGGKAENGKLEREEKETREGRRKVGGGCKRETVRKKSL